MSSMHPRRPSAKLSPSCSAYRRMRRSFFQWVLFLTFLLSTITAEKLLVPFDPVIENGIYALSSLEQIQAILDRRTLVTLCLVLLYDPSCPHTQAVMDRVEEAHRLLVQQLEKSPPPLESNPPVLFVKLSIDGMSQDDLNSIGVTAVPSLVLVRYDGTENTFLLEYAGLSATATDLFRTVLHYYSRLVVTAGQVKYTPESVDVYPRPFANEKELLNFMHTHRAFLLEFSVVEPGLPPTLSETEQLYVRWLLQEEGEGDDFVLLVQCRLGNNEPSELYETFDTMSQVLTSRRDRLFVTISSDCQADGSVVSWKIPLDFSFQTWDKLPHCTSSGDTTDALVEFMTKVSTPSILWFDRQATAPIAFPLYRKVHAVLFVDLHNNPDKDKNRSALRQFRNACRIQRRDSCDDDMVCLVVPSTETRILTTFGVDLWTALDEGRVDDQPLPAVLITDQRLGGTVRYSLDTLELASSPTAIHEFISDVWAGRRALHPTQGAVGLTSDTRLPTHALVFFTAPTCGHCKRFAVVWNALADLLQQIEWTHLLKLYKMDVTTDDVSGWNNVPRWVPDLYYWNRQRWIRYNETDEMGNGVGKINSPMDILAWFLAEFEDDQVLETLLQDLENKF
jgi:thiol-disulfide isomerase/thioredoxin